MCYPSRAQRKLLKATVIKEINATFSPEPGVIAGASAGESRERPLPCGRLDADWLARDDGRRVRSGYLAAEVLLSAAGRLQKFCSLICRTRAVEILARGKEASAP